MGYIYDTHWSAQGGIKLIKLQNDNKLFPVTDVDYLLCCTSVKMKNIMGKYIKVNVNGKFRVVNWLSSACFN